MTKLKPIKADIAVIGAGSGGLSVAAGAAMLGLKVVLFEKGEMGGDCLNYGCVPSKALISAAKHAQAFRDAEKYGLTAAEPVVDWTRVKAHVRSAIDTIAPVDSQERFEGLGVQVIREPARFLSPTIVGTDTVQVKARRIVIATGSRAFVPPIPGLDGVEYITNEEVFDLPEMPSHLVILGAGPIGMEMAQAFTRLGAKTTVVEMGQALARSEADHAKVVVDRMRKEGVTIHENAPATAVSKTDSGVRVRVEPKDGEAFDIDGSHLLVAVGRAPVLDSLDLDVGKVEFDRGGVKTKANLRSTSNGRVWAVGDAAGKGQFTHLAGWHASVFVRNALFKAKSKADDLPLPAVTYSEPEIAQVGMTEKEARAKYGDKVKTSSFPFHENDRAIAEGKTEGEAKLVTLPSGKILGASIVGDGAGDIVQLAGYAMSNGQKMRSLTNFISPYPTRMEVLKRAASKWYEPLVFGAQAKALVSVLQRVP